MDSTLREQASTGAPGTKTAKIGIGEFVKHRFFATRGVTFDVDPEFANTEEWYNAIPAEIRPSTVEYHPLYGCLTNFIHVKLLTRKASQEMRVPIQGSTAFTAAFPE